MKNERYGIISKAVMTDPTISITAKAIYAYLCSLTNNRDIAFPHRNTILRELGIETKTYYRHLRQLTAKGYLVILRDRGANRNNEYYTPNRHKGGYGFVFQSVMRSSLPIKAKALYAYLSAFAGTEHEAHPRRANILYHLHIAEGTYYTHLAELRKHGIISVVNSRVNGKLRATFFFLISAAEEISTMRSSSNPKNDHIKKDHTAPRKNNRSLTNSYKRLNREEAKTALQLRAMIRSATAGSYINIETRKRLNILLDAANRIFVYSSSRLKGVDRDRGDILKRAELFLNNGCLSVSDMIDIAEQSLEYEPNNITAYMSSMLLSRLYPRA